MEQDTGPVAPDPLADDPRRAPDRDGISGALRADLRSLLAVARAAAGEPHGRLAGWTVEQLTGGAAGNPTSGGIFRVSGLVAADRSHGAAGDGAACVPWSAVLKVVRSPVETGDAWDGPTGAIYWRREVDLLGSGLLDDAQGVVLPRCFGVVERSPAAAWLWLEDLGTMARSAWAAPEYDVAARALARFHAPYLTGRPLPDEPWLNRDLLRGFHAVLRPSLDSLMAHVRAGDPAYRPLDPRRARPEIATLLALVSHPERLLAALDAVPQTLCHFDTTIDNLLVRPVAGGGRELVVLDWQMVGIGPIGADLGQLMCNLPTVLDGTPRAAVEDRVLRAYVDELCSGGADLPLGAVRRAYLVDAALRQVTWAFIALGHALERAAAAGDAAAIARVVQEFVGSTAVSGLPELAHRAVEATAEG